MWNYLGEMKETHEEDRMLLVHGSPRDPIRDYMVPKDGDDEGKMSECFAKMNGADLCFVGHSHVPGVYPESGGFVRPDEIDGVYRVGQERALINIGSVGQPRDGDNRACYLVVDGQDIEWRRLEYDYEKTAKKIRSIGQLDDRNGERLQYGT